ncbi:hypothetical protein EV678_0600 [Azospira oryzae]|uniref:Uncharacterized protein n=1 Tax=Azospira oryzae TaxID=146939 RepID=A0ABY0IUF8_9RHOO|nr:hypothetical protein [Azospira oryzae]RZT89806.1 hypothetical protein EV678_0600 [Azospira oryzae]
MKGNNYSILRGVRAFSPLLQAYEAGYTIEEIKSSVFEALAPEFENAAMLDRYGIDLLTVEAVNIAKIRNSDWASSLFDQCLRIRRLYLANDPDDCAKTCASWEEPIGKALSLYWSAVRFEHEKADLPLDEFAYELFRNIGGLIEGTLQVYLKELLHLAQRSQGESVAFADVDSLGLGKVVQMVGEKAGIAPYLALPPWNVPLNQWRNIAQHYSMDSSGSSIVCRYGSKQQHSIALTRPEMLEVARALFLLFSTIRTAQTLFALDHADALVVHCKGFVRKEADTQFQFVVGAASQGFEVVELDVSEDCARAVLADVTLQDADARSIHASQFVYPLWIATRSQLLIIDYRAKSGNVTLRTTATADDCRKVYDCTEDLSYLATVVCFEPNPKA